MNLPVILSSDFFTSFISQFYRYIPVPKGFFHCLFIRKDVPQSRIRPGIRPVKDNSRVKGRRYTASPPSGHSRVPYFLRIYRTEITRTIGKPVPAKTPACKLFAAL